MLCLATVELGWLDGSLGDLTPEVRSVLDLLEQQGPRALHAELVTYLGRLGVDVDRPDDPSGPWRDTLHGRWRAAAVAWDRLGDRYEHALVLATAPDADARRRGSAVLTELGAKAVLLALWTPPPRPGHPGRGGRRDASAVRRTAPSGPAPGRPGSG